MAVIHAGFPYSSKVATRCIEAPSFGVNVIYIHIDDPCWQAVKRCSP
jgi:hypothetical protein